MKPNATYLHLSVGSETALIDQESGVELHFPSAASLEVFVNEGYKTWSHFTTNDSTIEKEL